MNLAFNGMRLNLAQGFGADGAMPLVICRVVAG